MFRRQLTDADVARLFPPMLTAGFLSIENGKVHLQRRRLGSYRWCRYGLGPIDVLMGPKPTGTQISLGHVLMSTFWGGLKLICPLVPPFFSPVSLAPRSFVSGLTPPRRQRIFAHQCYRLIGQQVKLALIMQRQNPESLSVCSRHRETTKSSSSSSARSFQISVVASPGPLGEPRVVRYQQSAA
jgi:hypothetical protein